MSKSRLRASTALMVLAFMLPQYVPAAPFAHYANAAGSAWPDEWQAESTFYKLWSRADEPLAAGAATRSWLWGPVPFAVANEPYAESPSGLRLVEYMDKARMELNDTSIDRQSPWYVTNGLLVNEMITGRVQTGNDRFEQRAPADVQVAGDAGGPTAPTYAAFARLTGAAASAPGKIAAQKVSRDGAVTQMAGEGAPADPKLFGIAAYDAVTRHNIPAVFRDWMSQSGTVLENGRYVQRVLFDPLYVLGRPLTEPYWADVPVGGLVTTVLMQLFERRALTYNPNNPPAWRVEMANVGRAYFDWRYKGTHVAPAISAELQRDGTQIRGWNWQPGLPVRVDIPVAGGPPVGPVDARPDAAGRFSVLLSTQNKVVPGGRGIATAEGQGVSIAIPVSGSVSGGPVQLEGLISQVGGLPGGAPSALLKARDGQEWNLEIRPGSAITYSEGDNAPPGALRPGMAVAVGGAASGDAVTVSQMRLMSVSRTGAQISYIVQPDRKSMRVSGTGWPAERSIALTLAVLNAGGPPPLKTARSDSRGNLSASVAIPEANALPSGPLWLFAIASDNNALLAQAAVPFDLPDSGPDPASMPPQLFVLGQTGEQAGGLGSYCWRKVCASTNGVPVPGQALQVKASEVLGFRSQIGADPQSGLSPDKFSAQLYTYDSPPGQTAQRDGILYFTPKAQPVHTTGDLPGRPFSVALPQVLPAGRYVLQVDVGWPDPAGGTSNAQYGFVLQAP